MLGMVPADEKATMLGRVEILSSAAAVQALEAASEIKTWDSTMAREELLAQADEVTMWYPTAGFVARKGEKETGKASIGMLAKFICKDGEGMRDKLVDVLGYVEISSFACHTHCLHLSISGLCPVIDVNQNRTLPSSLSGFLSPVNYVSIY